MSLFHLMVGEQVDLLREKGYDETNLRTVEPPGYIRQQMEINLSKALRETMENNEPYQFKLELTALPGRSLHVVDYRIDYSFDPDRATLGPYRLQLDMQGHTRAFYVKGSADLPHAMAAYVLLERDVASKEDKARSEGVKRNGPEKNGGMEL